VDEGSSSRPKRQQTGARSRSSGRAQKGGRKEVRALDAVIEEFERALGGRAASRAVKRYEAALQAFEAYRYDEARKILSPMAREYADVSAVHEMYGLCLYRAGQWKKAAEELERALVLNPDWIFNHAVLADCYRALGNHQRVEELWKEVAAASPNPELMAEARIVHAGSLADRGHLQEALSFMEKSAQDVNRPAEHHLRQWYVVGDLHDRLGNVIEARRFFERVATHEPGFADVVERLAALGS
jgi:tetratricopeptide (TPR) repeat protein